MVGSIIVDDKLYASLQCRFLFAFLFLCIGESLCCAWSEACINLESVRTSGEWHITVNVSTVGEVIVGSISRVGVTHVDMTSSKVSVGIGNPEVL